MKPLYKLLTSAALTFTLMGNTATNDELNDLKPDYTMIDATMLTSLNAEYFDHVYQNSQSERIDLVDQISTKYKTIDVDLIQTIVDYSYVYEKDDFPKAVDILALIGIESSFKHTAKSALKHDAAVGLTQVRPKVWSNVHDTDKLNEIEHQIRIGVEILYDYYVQLDGDAEGSLQAYNLGITNYRKGVRTPQYLNKFKRELAYLSE